MSYCTRARWKPIDDICPVCGCRVLELRTQVRQERSSTWGWLADPGDRVRCPSCSLTGVVESDSDHEGHIEWGTERAA